MHLTLFFFCTSSVFSSVFASSNGALPDCCLSISPKKVNVTSIVSYWQQDNRICPVKAIVFTLENGKYLCSDPDLDWTKKAMRKIDEEAEQMPNHSSGLAPDALQEKTEGFVKTTMLPLTSRWPQVPARVGISTRKRKGKPRRIKIKIIRKKEKGKNKGKKKKEKTIKQPTFNHTSSFTTS
ncbi:hypothetical protein KOW79_005981 [Hemibagrus wyckioides]|uniref:Chemokine interleukin-8-like domain-containing protein n=1 Tax=Hemibagrus wyckioides TaxID=337641 RepID=A0A9D3NX03_9TELE|nr:C-C motif chemokine 2-like [Hemibagrus wyckioides]KAG7329759.1 hypothetical protein KOW79_005981 [Hemibagrus wyckioides]